MVLCRVDGSMPTPSSAMRSVHRSPSRTSETVTFFASAYLLMLGQRFLHDAIERDAVGGREPQAVVGHFDPSGMFQRLLNWPHCHLSAAPMPRLSSSVGRRSSMIRRLTWIVSSIADMMRRRRERWASPPESLSETSCRSISAAASVPPSSSWISRAILAFSSSWSRCRWCERPVSLRGALVHRLRELHVALFGLLRIVAPPARLLVEENAAERDDDTVRLSSHQQQEPSTKLILVLGQEPDPSLVLRFLLRRHSVEGERAAKPS